MGDELFARRGEDAANLDAAITSWQAALVDFPDSALLLQRLSRAWMLRGLREPERRPPGFVVAREMGIRCLLTEPQVASLVSTFGRLDSRSIDESNRAICLTWASLSWSRWLLEHDVAGAAIDLDQVTAMARRAILLRPDAHQGAPHHALGLALSLPPEPLGPDLEGAERELLLAQTAAPDRWQVTVDLAVLVYGPQPSRHGEFRSLLEDVVSREPVSGPEGYGNLAAQLAAAEALEEGPRPRWAL